MFLQSSGSNDSVDQLTEASNYERRKKKRVVSRNSSCWGLPEPVLRVGGRTIFTHGRPPWYNREGRAQETFIIGICGGSASGKTSVARAIIQSLDVQWVSLFSLDSYYKVLTDAERQLAAEGNYNFDHPNSLDYDLIEHHLSRLRDGRSIQVPEYDFKTHSRTSKTQIMYGANVIVIEGVLAFYVPEILNYMNLKIFVDTDADERVARRLRRDITERGRDLVSVLDQYTRFVKPSYDQFIAPCMAQADIIIPRGGQNEVALQLLIQHVNKLLKTHSSKSRGLLIELAPSTGNGSSINCRLGVGPGGDCPGGKHADELCEGSSEADAAEPNKPSTGMNGNMLLPPRVHVLPSTPQTRGLHTLIRDHLTKQDDFIFYAERLMRPLYEYAMNLLPYTDMEVQTPQGFTYKGRQLAPGTQVCGVSIMRAGEALEPSLCAVCKDVRLGKILIQTNPDTSEPELHYLRLPSDIKDCCVILMDSTVATGAAAIMAMRILVEHDVPEERIILTSLLMAIQGIFAVAYTYPKAHIVTTAVDSRLSENYHIIPGVGNFGDRYFGTGLDES